MPTLGVEGAELFYEIAGAGYPCLTMHGGFGMDHTYFRPWLDSLGHAFRFAYYDHRCNGRSARAPVETMTFDRLCADADALRAALGYERCAVLGHSAGGFVALQYALRYARRVSHLILVSTAAAFDYGAEISANAVSRGATREMLEMLGAPAPSRDEAVAPAFMKVLPLYFHTASDGWAQAFVRTRWRAAAYGRNTVLFPQHDVVSLLAELTMPALVLTGEEDFICPPSQARRMHAALPHSSLALIPECGHFPFIERPRAFQERVAAWWQERGV